MLTLASDGWRFFFQDDTDELALGNRGVELTGGRVAANVIDPTSHATVPAPDDLVSWFASHSGLVAESPQPVSSRSSVSRSM